MVEKWSPGYWLFKHYVLFAWWLFHRKIVIIGKENIPDDKPVIYAGNHPNALNDDLAIIFSVHHQVVWLGRADLFKTRITKAFMQFVKIIPAYRIRDGKENLARNEETFATAVKVLMHNQAIGIYPEATHSINRRMIPHKKAIPRIVFLAGATTNYTLDIKIAPVGIYFDKYQDFGRRLLVIFGKPLDAKNYYDLYRENPLKATITLRNDLYQAILPLTLNYSTTTNYEGFEALREIGGKPLLRKLRWSNTMHNRFLADQQLIGKLDRLETDAPEKAEKLAVKGVQLIHRVKSIGIRNWLVDKAEEKTGKLILSILFLLVTLPLFAFGFLFSAASFFTLHGLVKWKVKQEIFRSTFTFALGIFLFPLVWLLELWLVSPLLPGWWLKLIFLVSLPFAGKFAYSWYIMSRKTLGRWRWLTIKRSRPVLYLDIHREKSALLDLLLS